MVQSQIVKRQKYITSEYKQYKAKLSREKNMQLIIVDNTELNCQKKRFDV